MDRAQTTGDDRFTGVGVGVGIIARGVGEFRFAVSKHKSGRQLCVVRDISSARDGENGPDAICSTESATAINVQGTAVEQRMNWFRWVGAGKEWGGGIVLPS